MRMSLGSSLIGGRLGGGSELGGPAGRIGDGKLISPHLLGFLSPERLRLPLGCPPLKVSLDMPIAPGVMKRAGIAGRDLIFQMRPKRSRHPGRHGSNNLTVDHQIVADQF